MNELKIKNSLITTLSLVLLLLTHQSLATESEPSNSNINNFTYPSHTCDSKPIKPIKPKKFTSPNNIDKYNNEISKYNINVATYNKKIKTYKSCINQYIKNGNNDIDTVRKKLNSALKEARSR